MKYFMLVCEGMADDPVEELGGRTPLEIAKTPFMDRLAKAGKTGWVSFVPHSLEASSDAACMSILGFDAAASYTGIAPLEAIAMGIAQEDRQIAFRCDLVTTLDDTLIDPVAGLISDREARILMQEVSSKLAGHKFKFHFGGGYKNILIADDPERTEEWNEIECASPESFVGQKIEKYLPKGKGSAVFSDLIRASKAILEDHEVNRVRIDLKENPANLIWLWGHGKKPKLPSFKERRGLTGGVSAKADFAKGLGKAAGFEVLTEADFTAARQDFIFVYHSSGLAVKGAKDLKTKVRFIEEFDLTVVGNAVRAADRGEDVRICVSTDVMESISKKANLRGHVPFLIYGKGVEAENAASFNERVCSQSANVIDDGRLLIDAFLKK